MPKREEQKINKRTYIGRALCYEMQRAHLTQIGLAKKADIPQPTISQIISSAVRIAPASLRALTHCWAHDENIRVLIAHLRDEISRAGHGTENSLDITMQGGKTATTRAEQHMEIIQRHISDPDVAALVRDIAHLLRRAEMIVGAR